MARFGKQILGAGGADFKNSPFLLEPKRSQVAENFRVTQNSRRRRPGSDRFLWTKHSANGMRFHGKQRHSYMVAVDQDNTQYNCNSSQCTIEFRIRLNGVEGQTYDDTIWVCARPVYESNTVRYTFAVQLINEGAAGSETDTYYVRFLFHESGGTSRTFNATTTTIKVGDDWTHFAIVRNPDSDATQTEFYKNGSSSQIVTVASSGTAIQGAFGTTEFGINHGDIVFGADETLASQHNFDIDEFRLWADDREDAEVAAYDDTDLPSTEIADSNLLCYINFEETGNDEYRATDQINTDGNVFLGGMMPFTDDDGTLVIQGTYGYAILKGQTSPRLNGFLMGNETKTTEVAFIPLKAREGTIIDCSSGGNIFIRLDWDGSSAYRVQAGFELTVGGAQTLEGASGTLSSSDFDGNTTVYVAVRNDTDNTTMELWVDGTLQDSHDYSSDSLTDSDRTFVTASTNDDRQAIKLKWLRGWSSALTTSYFQNNYSDDTDSLDRATYRHQVARVVYKTTTLATANGLSPSQFSTEWSEDVSDAWLGLHWNKELAGVTGGSNRIGLTLAEKIETFDQGTQTFDFSIPECESTSRFGSGISTAGDILLMDTGYSLTKLLFVYDEMSFKTKVKELSEHYFDNNNPIRGDVDSDGRSIFRMTLPRNVPNAITPTLAARDEGPSYIRSTVKLIAPKRVRYIGEIRDRNDDIDSLVVITGTALITIDKSTKNITEWATNIYPNDDKPFTGATLDRQLYLTDGKTRIHIYTYLGNIRVKRWGFLPLSEYKQTWGTQAEINDTSGSWDSDHDVTFCYYNREIDQYSETPNGFTAVDFSSGDNVTGYNLSVRRNLESDFEHGPTDLVILRTKDQDTGGGVAGEYYILDYTDARSDGYSDWSQGDSALDLLYPPERVGVPLNPPDADVVVEHRNRLFMLGGKAKDKLWFNAISGDLHPLLLKSETYTFPADHFIEIPGNRDLTAAASFADALFIFSSESIDILQGSTIADFTLRKLHEGIGCVAHRTLKNVGGFLVWLGLDDIYMLSGGTPRQLDSAGRIRSYIRDELDLDRLDEAFSVYNREEQVIEFHVIHKSDNVNRKVIVYDLIANEFTIDTDVGASAATEIIESSIKTKVYYGHESGFIAKHNRDSFEDYPPPSGSVRTTVSSYSGSTITTAAVDLSVADAGLVGNIVYIIDQTAGSTFGNVMRARITANTASTITHGTADDVFGQGSFTPASGDVVVIASPLWKLKTGYMSTGSQSPTIQHAASREGSGLISDLVVQELLDISFIKEKGDSTGQSYFILYRDGDTSGEDPRQIVDLDKVSTKALLRDFSRVQFFELEMIYLHEDAEFDFTGFVLGFNVTREDFIDG